MEKGIEITIKNQLVMEERDMNVYHHATKSAYMVSHSNSVTIFLKPDIEDDYLHLSIVTGPGYLDRPSVINLPSWANFEFSSMRDVTVLRYEGRVIIRIPPGLPLWQLRMTRSHDSPINQEKDTIIVGDN